MMARLALAGAIAFERTPGVLSPIIGGAGYAGQFPQTWTRAGIRLVEPGARPPGLAPAQSP